FAEGQGPRSMALRPKSVLTFPTGIGDNSLISLDYREENGFGFRSVQLGFPSAWAWNSFSPVWNSFSPAWNSFRRAGRADPGRLFGPFRSRQDRGDTLPNGERLEIISSWPRRTITVSIFWSLVRRPPPARARRSRR